MIVAMQKPHASVMTWKMTVYFEQSVQDEHLEIKFTVVLKSGHI